MNEGQGGGTEQGTALIGDRRCAVPGLFMMVYTGRRAEGYTALIGDRGRCCI